jgi:hypothetical protein
LAGGRAAAAPKQGRGAQPWASSPGLEGEDTHAGLKLGNTNIDELAGQRCADCWALLCICAKKIITFSASVITKSEDCFARTFSIVLDRS